jgi:hypothetical protein
MHFFSDPTQSLHSLLAHTGLQTIVSTQVPVELQVCRVTLSEAQRTSLGLQSEQIPLPVQRYMHAAPLFTHVPLMLQVCGCLLEQRGEGELELHSVHAPARHAGAVPPQVAPSIHWPLALQVRGVLPLQSLLLGAQAPPHMPLVQTLAQAIPLLAQCPVVSQSCGWLLAAQRVAPGEHSHAEVPTHTPVHTAPLATHCAFVLHVCGVLPLQRVVPGVQTPVHEPVALLQRKGHAVPFVQLPLLLQVWGTCPLHCVAPGLQIVHLACTHAKEQTMLTVHCPCALQIAW